MLGLGITKTPAQQMRASTSMFGMMQKPSVSLEKGISTSSFDDLSGMTIVVFCEQRSGNPFGTFQLQEFCGILGNDGGTITGLSVNTQGGVNWNETKQLSASVHDGLTAISLKLVNIAYGRWSSCLLYTSPSPRD